MHHTFNIGAIHGFTLDETDEDLQPMIDIDVLRRTGVVALSPS
jgi:hypothetical protein